MKDRRSTDHQRILDPCALKVSVKFAVAAHAAITGKERLRLGDAPVAGLLPFARRHRKRNRANLALQVIDAGAERVVGVSKLAQGLESLVTFSGTPRPSPVQR